MDWHSVAGSPVEQPVDVDAERVQAESRDGILVVLLPRAEKDRPRVPPAVTETSVCRLSGEPFRLKLLLSEGCWGHEAMTLDQPSGVVERAEFQQGLA